MPEHEQHTYVDPLAFRPDSSWEHSTVLERDWDEFSEQELIELKNLHAGPSDRQIMEAGHVW